MTRVLLTVGLMAAMFAARGEEAPPPEDDTVVLLHGMGRTSVSLWILEARLEKAGYSVLKFSYSASAESLDEMSARLDTFLREEVQTGRYHFIGHSLGNIIVRNAFKRKLRPGLGRMVMLAPPNEPAFMAEAFREMPLYQWLSGDSGQKLSSEEFYKTLPVPGIEFGVIAGDRGHGLITNEANDGIITVESTKLPGMKDWILLHHTHTFLMNSRDTAEQCVHFLKNGAFKHPAREE